MVIYKTTNLVNKKIYIGQSKNNRKNYFGSGFILKNAITKYGVSNFKKEILEECNSKKELNEREIYWIKKTKSQDKNIGYNIACGGSGGDTFSNQTDENKRKIRDKRSKSMKGKNTSPMTEEQKLKISNTLKGRKCPKHSQYMKIKMSNVSDEYKKKLSISSKKRWDKYHKENPNAGRKIVQLTKTGEFVKVYTLYNLRSEPFSIANIYAVITGKRKTANGFKWKFQDDFNR